MNAPASVGTETIRPICAGLGGTLRDEWAHCAVQHPDREAEIEVEERSEERGGWPDFRKSCMLAMIGCSLEKVE